MNQTDNPTNPYADNEKIDPRATNKHNLHDSFFLPLAYRPFGNWKQRSDELSVTELTDSPRLVWMRRMYSDHIRFDVSERYHSVMGQSVHRFFEMISEIDPQRFLSEKRVKAKLGEWIIRGRLDLGDLQDRMIVDYKNTSVWSIIFGNKDDWGWQTNIYRYLIKYAGYIETDRVTDDDGNVSYVDTYKTFDFTKIQINAIIKDWNKNKAKFERDYPKIPFVQKRIDVMTDEEVGNYISERLSLHKVARDAAIAGDQSLMPKCTTKDRWASEDKWAVKKINATRATKVCSSHTDAEAYMKAKGYTSTTHIIEHRPGSNLRCEEYCPVKQWCTQYQQEIAKVPAGWSNA